MTEFLGVLMGLLVALILGPVVGWFVEKSTADIKLLPPEGVTEEDWQAATRMPSETPGKWLGGFERVLSFVAFKYQGLEIIAGWLALKVASKWEIWHNIVHVPESLKDVHPLSYLRARRAWGSYMMMRFLIGTVANILAGFLGFLAAKHGISVVRMWLC